MISVGLMNEISFVIKWYREMVWDEMIVKNAT